MARSFRRSGDGPDRAWFGRPLGPAVVEGAVRGAIAGALPGLVVGVVLALGRALTGFAFDPMVLAVAVLPVVGFTTVLATADAVSLRLALASRRRATRFVGGFLAPFAAAAPVVALIRNPLGPTAPGDPRGILLAATLVSLVIAFAQELVPPIPPGSTRDEGCARLGCLLFVVGGALGLTLVPVGGGGAAFATVTATLACGLVASLPGAALGARAARAVEAWIEPDWRDPGRQGARMDDLVAASRRELRLAREATDEGTARARREQALAHAWTAVAEPGEGPETAIARATATHWLLELHLELGQDADKALALVADAAERDVLRAELLRSRGDAAGALTLASQGAAAAQGTIRTVRRAREAAAATAALALADLGRHDDAARRLDEARRRRDGKDPILERHGLGAVEAHLARRRLDVPPAPPSEPSGPSPPPQAVEPVAGLDPPPGERG